MDKAAGKQGGKRGRRKLPDRSPNLSVATVKVIVSKINDWRGRLTWADLTAVVAQETGFKYVRQTLHNNGSIRAAYKSYQETQKRSVPGSKGPEEDGESAAIRRLRQQVLQLTKENSLLLERFARWAYNASVRGLDEEFLDNPLPPIDRRHR